MERKTFIQIEVGDILTEEMAAILLGIDAHAAHVKAITGEIPGAMCTDDGMAFDTAAFAEAFGLPKGNAEGWDTVWEPGQCLVPTGKCLVCGAEYGADGAENPDYCCKAHALRDGAQWDLRPDGAEG